MKNNHTHLTRLAAISFVLMLCLSALPMLAPSASAAGEDAPLGSSASDGRGYLAICFDDGLKSNYDVAYPVLAEAGIPATAYIITSKIDSNYNGRPTMNATQLLELQAAGWEIGSHSVTDPNLTEITLEEAEAEFRDSKATLEALGLDVKTFAYPRGEFNQTLVELGSRYYERQRTTLDQAHPNSWGINLYLSEYPSAIQIVGARGPTTLAYAAQDLDRAVTSNSAVVWYLHGQDKDGTLTGFDYTIQELADLVSSYVRDHGLRCVTMSDLPNNVGSYVWDGEGDDSLASNPINWRYVSPDGTVTNNKALATDCNYIFNGTSTKDCTWDLDRSVITPRSFYVLDGYTGTISQGDVDMGFGSGGFLIRGGRYTANVGHLNVCDGPYWVHGGFISNNVLRLEMRGVGQYMAIGSGIRDTNIHQLIISGQIYNRGYTRVYSSTEGYDLQVEPGASIYSLSGSNLQIFYYDIAGPLVNHGVISGEVPFAIFMTNSDKEISFGTVRTTVDVRTREPTRSNVLTVTGGDVDRLRVRASDSTSYTVTVDLAGNTITAGIVSVEERGIIGNGTIRTMSWDSTAGTILDGTSLILSDGGTVELAPGQAFDRLEISSGNGRTASWTMNATGTVSPIVTGLKSGSYLWYLDGVEQGEVKADKDGTIALSYESTGLHSLEVKPTPMTEAMDGVYQAVGIVAVLAMLGGLITMLGRLKF
jgi:peptidoglycan/xylan/chitin deacetylase (PgdA/CDA1 family)